MDYWISGNGANILSFWGWIITVVGFVATIVGFVFTIRASLGSRKAAEEANRAVADVREDLRRLDIVSNLSEAIGSMEEIKRLHREAAWPVMPDRYSSLRKLLITIRSSDVFVLDHHRDKFVGAIQQLAIMEREVERFLSSTGSPTIVSLNVPRLNGIISDQEEFLMEIREEIKNSVGDEHEQRKDS